MIPVPSGVKIQIKDGAVDVQGPKGKMNVPLPHGIYFEQKDGTLSPSARRNSIARCTAWRALWWPMRSPA